MNTQPSSLKKLILVVDDDNSLRTGLKNFLIRMGHEVIDAANIKLGLEYLSTKPIDLVISDINMPGGSGIDLLERTRKFSMVPFILMTGLSTITQARKAREYGVKYFLAKPFDLTELKKAIKSSLDKDQMAVAPPLELIQVHLDEFVNGADFICDAYLRMGKSEFVKVTHGGESMSSEEVARCHLDGIDSLYVLKSDFKKLLRLGENFYAEADTETQARKRVFFRHVSGMLQVMRTLEEMNPSLFFKAQVILESTLSVLVDNLTLFEIMNRVGTRSPLRLQKSVMMALMSVMLGKNFPEINSRGLFLLASAAFLHEIGEEAIMEELLVKPREEYTAFDKEIMDAHCIRSVNVLQRIPDLPNEIYKLLMCHHKDKIDSGRDEDILNCLKLSDELTMFPLQKDNLRAHLRETQEKILKSQAGFFSGRVLSAMGEMLGQTSGKTRLFKSGLV